MKPMKLVYFRNSELPRVRMKGTALAQKPIYLDHVFALLVCFFSLLEWRGGRAYSVGMVEPGITPLTLMRRMNCLDKFLILLPPAMGNGTSKFTCVIFLGDVTLLRTPLS